MFYWSTITDTGIHCNGHRWKSNPTTQILLKPVSSSIKQREDQPLPGDWVGFSIPNEFVVGYGLDYDGRYRELPTG